MKSPQSINRRTFLRQLAAAGSVAAISAGLDRASAEQGEKDMKVFPRQSIDEHGVDLENALPEFLGRVGLGEGFAIETQNSNAVNGPVEIEGVRAGDDIAIRIEEIRIVPPIIAANGGPIDGLPGFELELRDGWLHFPAHFRVRPRPTIGNVAVLPDERTIRQIMAWGEKLGYRPTSWRQWVNDPRMKHCHQDCPFLGPGATIHMKAQVDGAGLCMADFHVFMGEGEMAFNGISSAAGIRARVERSSGWLVDWPLVETAAEIMVCVTGDQYVPVVREAFRACRELVAARAGCTVQEANALVAFTMDLRNSAIYGLGDGYLPGTEGQPSKDLSVVGVIRKEVFL